MEITHILNQLQNRKAQMMDAHKFQRYGIFIPLVTIDGASHLLFEVRSMKLNSQPGDVCFPGGRMDTTDAGPLVCALRETEEEVGIPPYQMDHIIPLDYLISGSRIIYPFAGRVSTAASVAINEEEVAEVFTVPLAFFMNYSPQVHHVYLHVKPADDFPYDLIQNGKSYDWRTREMDELFYVYGDRVIWGLTAKIVHHFVQLLNETWKG